MLFSDKLNKIDLDPQLVLDSLPLSTQDHISRGARMSLSEYEYKERESKKYSYGFLVAAAILGLFMKYGESADFPPFLAAIALLLVFAAFAFVFIASAAVDANNVETEAASNAYWKLKSAEAIVEAIISSTKPQKDIAKNDVMLSICNQHVRALENKLRNAKRLKTRGVLTRRIEETRLNLALRGIITS